MQEFSRTIGVDKVKVQLWDCSGSMQYQAYWSVLGKDVDGLLMVMDPNSPEQERELEALYMNFAQPANLTIKQCLTLAVQVVKSGDYTLGAWEGMKGKMSQLPSGYVALNPASIQSGLQEAFTQLDKLLVGCVARKKQQMENAVVGGGDEEQ